MFASPDGGQLEHQGEIGGQPAALVAEGPRELYVALHDGTIKHSTDGGNDLDGALDAVARGSLGNAKRFR